MIVPRIQDVKHKNQLFRLLREILKNNILSNNLQFKGGTYAALRGVLDRFSVDLDFDLPDKSRINEIKEECYKIFQSLNLEIKDQSQRHLQFFLKYPSKENERNTLKLEINDNVSIFNKYEKVNLLEISLYCSGHTLDTMFANKLVAAKARFDKNGKIAGRDFYDIYKFFTEGISVNIAVVEERTGQKYVEYLATLQTFIDTRLTDKLLYQDLNPLIPTKNMLNVMKNLKVELKVLINDELNRWK